MEISKEYQEILDMQKNAAVNNYKIILEKVFY